ncbi:hypothetical protein J132_11384, partial [Termitomyces sp. J132]
TTAQVASVLFNEWYCENGLMEVILKHYKPNNPTLSSNREYTCLSLVVTEDKAKDQYLIEKIIDAQKQGHKRQYLVQWVGYGPKQDKWLPGSELENCGALNK